MRACFGMSLWSYQLVCLHTNSTTLSITARTSQDSSATAHNLSMSTCAPRNAKFTANFEAHLASGLLESSSTCTPRNADGHGHSLAGRTRPKQMLTQVRVCYSKHAIFVALQPDSVTLKLPCCLSATTLVAIPPTQ